MTVSKRVEVARDPALRGMSSKRLRDLGLKMFANSPTVEAGATANDLNAHSAKFSQVMIEVYLGRGEYDLVEEAADDYYDCIS